MAGILVAVGACSDGDSDAGDPPPETTSTTAATPVTTGRSTATTSTTVGSGATTVTASPTTGVPGEVTLRGPVSAVFASARVLVFDPPVDGYSRAALTSETEYRLADGSPATLLDVSEGSVVAVTGEPGAPGALIARVVTIVG